MTALGVTCFASSADAPIAVFVDGKPAGIALMVNGVSYIPLRAVSEALGAKVDYDSSAHAILLDFSHAGIKNGQPINAPPQSPTSEPATSAPAASPAPTEPDSATYYVDGDATSADVTYSNSDGGTEQQTVSLPWQQTIYPEKGAFLYISAQNQGNSGDIKVEIDVDGSIRKSAKSSGAYSIASTSDTM
jgi:hypothetical protein